MTANASPDVGSPCGPALADAGDFAGPFTRRLEELRLEARVTFLTREIGAGSAAARAGELEALVAEHPLHEQLTGLVERSVVPIRLHYANFDPEHLVAGRADRVVAGALLLHPPRREVQVPALGLGVEDGAVAPQFVVAERPSECFQPELADERVTAFAVGRRRGFARNEAVHVADAEPGRLAVPVDLAVVDHRSERCRVEEPAELRGLQVPRVNRHGQSHEPATRRSAPG